MTLHTLDDEARRGRRFTRINKADVWFQVLGLSWMTPVLKSRRGRQPAAQLGEIWRLLGVPLLAIAVFAACGRRLRRPCKHRLGRARTCAGLGTGRQLASGCIREGREKRVLRTPGARNAEHIANGDTDRVRDRIYTGKPTYYDQIWTSIKTVFFGFLIASIVAIPLGIAAGLSVTANAALNPLIQIFKPVSRWHGCRL